MKEGAVDMGAYKRTAENERVPVEEAARILGMSRQGVREHMKRNLFSVPIGEVTNPSGRREQYHIYRSMLDRHLGKKEGKADAD